MTRVLVVEDDAIIAAHVAETLERLGYDVPAIAESGEQALREVAAQRPDLVLMDVHLRGPLDGIDTVSKLRKTTDVAVIYLTAHTDEATLARAKETAPHGYLVKPFNERDLRTSIEVAVHKHALERRLAASERWFATTLESLGDAVIATDPDERITFMNPVAETITGFTREAARGRPLVEVFRLLDDAGNALASPLGLAMRDRFTVALPPNTELVDRGGARRLVDDSAAPIVDERGNLLGGVIVFRDVSERRKLERRLEVAERLASLGTMASGIAHELNNPLAAVMGNVTFAIEELAAVKRALGAGQGAGHELDECRAALEDAAVGSERLRKIIEAMRWFVDRKAEKRAVVDLPDLLEPAIKLTHGNVYHKAKLVRAYGTSPFVDVDERQLVQVFVNLLNNAADAMPEGHAAENQITVATATDDAGRAVVEIRDTGAGISQADIARIFDPFFSTKAIGSGLGLGLAICHSFVLAAGGDLTVDSERGRGSVFRVSLPPAAREPASAEPPSQRRSRRRARILVLDDEPSVARVISRLLSEHEIVCELDGHAVLARIAAGDTFDVILCDMMMPTLTGADIYEAIESANPNLAAKIVFLTGGSFSPRATEFLEHTKNAVLSKPFALEALRAAIDDVLGR